MGTALLAHAGSGTAKLTCTSGRTTFTANLQDIVGIYEGGMLTIDGAALVFP